MFYNREAGYKTIEGNNHGGQVVYNADIATTRISYFH
jgi:hypothetical protein